MDNKVDTNLTATLKYAQSSTKKMGLIGKFVRGKKVNDALNLLNFAPHKAGKQLYKLIMSAAANATHNAGLRQEDLVVQEIYVGTGPKLKRFKFVGRSRVHAYEKHRCFVKVFLAPTK